MGLMDKARQTAEQARIGVLGERPAPTEDGAPDANGGPPPASRAAAAVSSFIEKINPGLLADLIIHATSAQEKANKALKDKGSQYRISEMYLTATIPPQVGFYIARLGDEDGGEPAVPALPAAKKTVIAKAPAPAAAAKKATPVKKAAAASKG